MQSAKQDNDNGIKSVFSFLFVLSDDPLWVQPGHWTLSSYRGLFTK